MITTILNNLVILSPTKFFNFIKQGVSSLQPDFRMAKYKFDEDEIIEGNTPEELVTALRDGSLMASDQTLEEYMKGFAERYKVGYGKIIRFDQADNFIEDLINNKVLQKV